MPFVLLTTLLAFVDPAPPTVSISWAAPAECPAQAEIESAITRLSGARIGGEAADLVVSAEVEHATDGYIARISLHRGTWGQTRTLEAADCDLLSRLSVVVVAVALDPVSAQTQHTGQTPRTDEARKLSSSRTTSSSQEVEHTDASPSTDPRDADSNPTPPAPRARASPDTPEDAGDEVPEAPSAEDRTAPNASSSTPPASEAARSAEPPPARPNRGSGLPRLELGGSFGPQVGGLLLPGVGAGLRGAFYLGVRHLHVALVTQYWLPRRVSSTTRDDVGARLQQFSAGVRGCPQARWGRWHLRGCTGPDLGFIQGWGEGAGLATQRSAVAFWAGWAFSVGVEVDLTPRVALGALAEVELSMQRPTFSLEGLDEPLHQVGLVGPAGALVVIIRR